MALANRDTHPKKYRQQVRAGLIEDADLRAQIQREEAEAAQTKTARPATRRVPKWAVPGGEISDVRG